MHRLQQHILYSLATNERLLYSRLKPEEVEGNAFTYHLRSLTKLGYIAHADEWYYLTSEGKLYIDQVSLKTFIQPLQPKIVLLMVARNLSGEILFFERNRHPLINRLGFPYGKIHANETIQQAAARELRKKTGYNGTFKYHSTGTMKFYEKGELTSYIMYLLITVTDIVGNILDKASAGKSLWSFVDILDSNILIPSVHDILQIESSPNVGLMTELSYDLN